MCLGWAAHGVIWLETPGIDYAREGLYLKEVSLASRQIPGIEFQKAVKEGLAIY